MVEKASSRRDQYVDVAKGILITCIVLLHISYNSGEIVTYIYRFISLIEVTIFFVISGFYITDEKILKPYTFIKGKVKSLYVKFVVVGITAVILHNYLISLGVYELGTVYYGKRMIQYDALDYIKNIVLTMLCANREVIIGPMWFADVLFLAYILYCSLSCLIFRLIRDKNKAAQVRFFVLLVAMSVSVLLTSFNILNINRCSNTVTATFLLCVGQWLNQVRKERFESKYRFYISFVLLAVIAMYTSFALNSNEVGSPVYLLVVAIAGSYFVFHLSKAICKLRLVGTIEHVGKSSFCIMSMHLCSFKVVMAISGGGISKLVPETNSLLIVLAYLLVGIFIPVISKDVAEFMLNKVRKLITQ